MTVEESFVESPITLVRIKRTVGSGRHFHKGRLVRIDGDYGIVKPFNHGGREERIPMNLLVLWTSQNTQLSMRMTNSTAKYRIGAKAGLVDDELDPIKLLKGSAPKQPSPREWLHAHEADLEFFLVSLLDDLSPARQKALLAGNASSFLKELVLARASTITEMAEALTEHAGFAIDPRRLKGFVGHLASSARNESVASRFPDLFAAAATPADLAVEAPVPQSEPAKSEIIELPFAADLAESDTASMQLPTFTDDDLRMALRRVVRDTAPVNEEERYALEAAIVGEPQLNASLDELEIDEAAAEILQCMGLKATEGTVREARLRIWPVEVELPAPAEPIDVLRSALASGDLDVDDVLHTLIGLNGIATPTDLARRCVGLGMEALALKE